MLTVGADPEEVRKKTREAIALLNEDEFVGLIMLVLGDHNVRTSTIWHKVESIFFEDPAFEFPIPHPVAFIEMGEIATERRLQGENK